MLDFVVVGAQKSGTTWLYEAFDQHPGIFVPPSKELHYLCPSEECRFSTQRLGRKWYIDQFQGAKSNQIKGELTTDYMFYPGTATALSELNTTLKIICCLRDPIERAHSAYWMKKRHNHRLHGFDTEIRTNSRILERGLYYRQLEPFFNVFAGKNILVLVFEEFFINPIRSVQEVFKFLEVDETFTVKNLGGKVGSTKVLPPAIGYFYYKIASPLLNSKRILPLWKRVRQFSVVTNIMSLLLNERDNLDEPRLIDDATRIDLYKYYKEDQEKLFELLGRRIDVWDRG